MTQIRNLPLGIQTFEDIRNRNFVYVDKSRYVYELASFGKTYFLSRPRSFGKSLFLSTLRAYFEGQKEMFKGLDLEQLEPQLAKTQNREELIKHPVLYLDFNVGSYTTLEEFKESLNTKLSVWEKEYGITQELVGKKSHAYWLNSELPIPMLYQTGYLTIKGYETDIQSFTLGFPNNEVRYGFFKCLVPYYAGFENGSDRIEIVNFIKEIRNGQTEKFMKRIQCIFSSEPQKTSQKYYELNAQAFFWLIFKLIGQFIQCEVQNGDGRSDAVVWTKEAIYVFEFKLDGTAQQAIEQIKSKNYAILYQNIDKKIVLVGANFSSKTKNLTDWIIE
ncbi:MAG: ATP-binding protein [Treponemataceae bacterium]|nr:ATP-binding protein [Treponemataceae bacterium]